MSDLPETSQIRRRWFYYITVFVVIVVVFTTFGLSFQPVSFEATDFKFTVSNGIVSVSANITNLSTTSIIQVNAVIGGFSDGSCNGIPPDQMIVCNFVTTSGGVPLAGCGELFLYNANAKNYTLTLSAYFSSTKTVVNSYMIPASQIGCTPPKF